MIAGLWVAPVVLAGLVVILWITTLLERLVARPPFEPELKATPKAADAGFTDVADTVAQLVVGHPAGGRLGHSRLGDPM
jgi:hypothetical protein